MTFQHFVGISLTPTDTFDSGLVVLDAQRQILRMDKFLQDAPALQSLETLAEPAQLKVAVELPKNIMIPGKFRFEKVRMHPLRLHQPDGTVLSRYADRLYPFLEGVTQAGIVPIVFAASQVRQAWQVQPPFRTRSSAYCKQLQGTLKQELGISNLPVQMPAATLLDAMVAALVSWSVNFAEEGVHYQLEPSDQWPGLPEGLIFYRALERLPVPVKTRFRKQHIQY